jgi:hypothetical protein
MRERHTQQPERNILEPSALSAVRTLHGCRNGGCREIVTSGGLDVSDRALREARIAAPKPQSWSAVEIDIEKFSGAPACRLAAAQHLNFVGSRGTEDEHNAFQDIPHRKYGPYRRLPL